MMRGKSFAKKCLCLSAFCLCLSAPVAAFAAVTGSADVRVYDGRLDKYETLRVYHTDRQPTVPYVSAVEYLEKLYETSGIAFHGDEADGVLTAVRNGIEVTFDSREDTLVCADWDAFFGSYGERALPNGVLAPNEFNAQAVSRKHRSTETEARGFAIDLKRYEQDIVWHEDGVLLPFAVLQNVFATPMRVNRLSFNGDSFYDISEPMTKHIYGFERNPLLRRNAYADAYYAGSFSKRTEIPADYARYAYGTNCLLFDMYYGHKEEKGIKDFDSYLAENGLKEDLLSTDRRKSDEAFLSLLYKLFDSGHDAILLRTGVFQTGAIAELQEVFQMYGPKGVIDALQRLVYRLNDKGVDFLSGEVGTYAQYAAACEDLGLDPILLHYIFRGGSKDAVDFWLGDAQAFLKVRGTPEEKIEVELFTGMNQSKEFSSFVQTVKHIEALKPEDFSPARVDIIDDTAFIYFENFNESGNEARFYFDPPAEEVYASSTFGLFYDAFAQIQRAPQVKRVVIDLSSNGGGAVGALSAVLGFLAPDGEANITYYNTLNQNYCSEWYHVDTNLDGQFDARDGFGGQYAFYILTSGYSYSCANALPFFAQQGGLAKVIGDQPGGGDCLLLPFQDTYGHVATMSSNLKLGRMKDGSFFSTEHAVKVDIPFGAEADKLYFNYPAIVQLLHERDAL